MASAHLQRRLGNGTLETINKAAGGWARAPRVMRNALVAEQTGTLEGADAKTRPVAAAVKPTGAKPASADKPAADKPAAVKPATTPNTAKPATTPSTAKAVATPNTAKPAAAAPKPAAASRPFSSTASRPYPCSSSTPSAPRCASGHRSAASCIRVPPLDVSRPHPDVALIKGPSHLSDSAVFVLRSGSEQFVVKQTPFYTPERAARLATLDDAPRLVLEEQAMHEATVAREIAATASAASTSASTSTGDVFVQPVLVYTRACSRTCVASSSAQQLSSRQAARLRALAPDREVIAVYPLHTNGDAVQHIYTECRRLMAQLTAGKLFLSEVVEQVVKMLTALTLNMFELVDVLHLLGYILIDHKLENMVYDSVKARWQLIDAAEVRRCRVGEKYLGPSGRTPFYEAPEHKAGLGWDSRTDVFACGRAILMAGSDCMECFSEALGGKHTPAFQKAHAAMSAALEPLWVIITSCANEKDPEARPTAAEALSMMRDLQRWAL